jgi:hypothetical protein
MSLPARAQQKPADPAPVKACSLLTREEVRKLIPWPALIDPIPTREEPVGTTGSSCNYPNAHIQVLAYTPRFLESAKKRGPLEPVADVGDEAYFYNNRNEYAELYVKAGQRIVTVQKDIGTGETYQSVKPSVVALGKALVAKLR